MRCIIVILVTNKEARHHTDFLTTVFFGYWTPHYIIGPPRRSSSYEYICLLRNRGNYRFGWTILCEDVNETSPTQSETVFRVSKIVQPSAFVRFPSLRSGLARLESGINKVKQCPTLLRLVLSTRVVVAVPNVLTN
jgi:hypothetical protein